jgi:hypothetical protein
MCQELTLVNCVLTSKSFDQLIEFLDNTRSLFSLDISNCVGLQFCNLQQLSSLLKSDVSLLHFYVACDESDSTEQCWLMFSDMLRYNDTLRSLRCPMGYCNALMIDTMISTLEVNPSIVSIRMVENEVDSNLNFSIPIELLIELDKLVQRNQT